ncbi:MAG: hypothetical protein ACI4DP_04830 [Candidatus Ornithomonoglobus sp.]
MTKNITVIDENGNIVGSTYPKRADGLVKKGRARWISDTAVCLRADENENESEANEMAANIYEVFDNQISKMQEQLRDETAETAMPVRMQILKTMEVFRAQQQGEKVIDLVKTQLDMMQEALKNEPATPENALARETTRQKMLGLIEKLLDNGGAPQSENTTE